MWKQHRRQSKCFCANVGEKVQREILLLVIEILSSNISNSVHRSQKCLKLTPYLCANVEMLKIRSL